MALVFRRGAAWLFALGTQVLPATTQVSGGVDWQALGGQPGSLFGGSVAAAGDINSDGYDDVLVGARQHSTAGGMNEGAAFVYFGSASGLEASPAWSLLGPQAGSGFGVSVAGVGDVDNDGYNDVVVGADVAGMVFLYRGGVGGPQETLGWNQVSPQPQAAFGSSIAGIGDVNLDGCDDLLVGAPGYDADDGAAWIYFGQALDPWTTPGLSESPSWEYLPGYATSKVGGSLAGVGDVNGDGVADFAIGAQYFDGAHTNEGLVTVFFGHPGGPSLLPDWTLTGGQPNAGLGNAVAGAGDVNDDGYDDILVAAQRWSGGQSEEGRVALHLGGPSGPSSTAAWIFEGSQAGALLGCSVAGIGYWNPDDYADVILGARYWDNGHTNEGAAFLFRGNATGLEPIPSVVFESNNTGAELGYAVAPAGDVNRDGGTDLVVGAWRYDATFVDEGMVAVDLGNPHPAGIPRYVSGSAPGPGNGSAQKPYPSLQRAIEHAKIRHGDVIHVSPGGYGSVVGLLDFEGKAICVRSIAGQEVTHITGQVAFRRGEDQASQLEGFTIAAGAGILLTLNNGPTVVGGGMLCLGTSPRITDCTITGALLYPSQYGGGNVYGGGVYSTGEPEFIRCSISNNFIASFDNGHAAGGGLFGPATLRECTISGNTVGGYSGPGNPVYGGGVAHASLNRCIVEGNSLEATSWEDSNPTFGYGAGVAYSTLIDCTVSNNILGIDASNDHTPSYGLGGGAYGSSLLRTIVSNNRIWASANPLYMPPVLSGGGVADGSMEHCTVSGNSTDTDGGGLYSSCCMTVTDSVIWGNVPDSYHVEPGGDITFYFSTVEGGALGYGVLPLDPLFWNGPKGDFHLRPGSPCVASASWGDDMGALPYDPSYCFPPTVYCTAGVSASGCTAVITSSGIPSASAMSGFHVIATGVEGSKDGLLFFGTSGLQANPWGNGTSYQCVAPPVKRSPVLHSGSTLGACNGSFLFDLTAHWTLKPSSNPGPGKLVHSQFWYRDPGNTSNQKTSLSDALEFGACP